MKISHQKILPKKIIIIDGITRTGKMMLSRIIPSLKNFEQVEYVEFIEYILAALKLKKISFDFANSFIVQTLNEMSYNKFIGRKQNFRPNDVTSVKNFLGKKIYEKRFRVSEGKKTFLKVKKSKNFFPIMSHDIMTNFNLFKKFKINFKMIQIYRNPFDLVYSWYKRGWGDRWKTDPQPNGLLIRKNNALYPWYVAGKEKFWEKHNSVERCALLVNDLTQRSINNNLKEKKNPNILIVSYEDFIENTNTSIQKICKFLRTKRTAITKKILIKENCPKKYNKKNYLFKKKFIKSKISKKIFNDILILEKKYKSNIYNLLNDK